MDLNAINQTIAFDMDTGNSVDTYILYGVGPNFILRYELKFD